MENLEMKNFSARKKIFRVKIAVYLLKAVAIPIIVQIVFGANTLM